MPWIPRRAPRPPREPIWRARQVPRPVANPVLPITPAARHLAEQHGVDLTRLTGTGRDGVIVVADVRRALPSVLVETK